MEEKPPERWLGGFLFLTLESTSYLCYARRGRTSVGAVSCTYLRFRPSRGQRSRGSCWDESFWPTFSRVPRGLRYSSRLLFVRSGRLWLFLRYHADDA